MKLGSFILVILIFSKLWLNKTENSGPKSNIEYNL